MNQSKFTRNIFIGLLCLIYSTFSFSKAVTSNEYQQVIDTAYNYFKGVAEADQTLLSQAFDMDFGHIKMIKVEKEGEGEIESINSLLLSEFATFFKQPTKDKWEADILSVDIVEDKMAMVKLNFETPKTRYIDYLVMYKRNGQWKIINKTFYSETK